MLEQLTNIDHPSICSYPRSDPANCSSRLSVAARSEIRSSTEETASAALATAAYSKRSIAVQLSMAAPRRRIVHPAPAGTVVAYVRVSTDEQAASGAGLDAQRAVIAAEVERRGWKVIAWHADEGISGGKCVEYRPGLAAAIDAVRSGQAAVLLAAKLDRISRSVLDTASLMEQARRDGWELVTCDLAIDTSTPAGEATASMMAVFSQLERRLISQRTREALAIKKAQGVRLGRPSSLPSQIVKRIIENRVTGNSLRCIVASLAASALMQGVAI
jgi:DNA invertase Pin-like site-specific DNA recombinase